MIKLSTVLEEVVIDLGLNKQAHAKRTHKDDILQTIGGMFDSRVGAFYSEEKLDAICKEGNDRYANSVPPGYKDNGKDDTSSPVLAKHKRYGDLIMWNQIIDKANEVNKGIIFITDDKKEDWWLIFKGKTLGPRPELISEFLDKCNQKFYMYQADRFLELAAGKLKQEITRSSVDEIRQLSASDEARRKEIAKLRDEEEMIKARIQAGQEHMMVTRTQMESLQRKASELQHWRAAIQERFATAGGRDQASLDKLLEYTQEAETAEMELHKVQAELSAVTITYERYRQRLLELEHIYKKA